MNEIERAIDSCIYEKQKLEYVSEKDCNNSNLSLLDRINLEKIKIKALQEKLEREENKPLTVQELKDMVGEPVYFIPNDDFAKDFHVSPYWEILSRATIKCLHDEGKFYKHKPKEVE